MLEMEILNVIPRFPDELNVSKVGCLAWRWQYCSCGVPLLWDPACRLQGSGPVLILLGGDSATSFENVG